MRRLLLILALWLAALGTATAGPMPHGGGQSSPATTCGPYTPGPSPPAGTFVGDSICPSQFAPSPILFYTDNVTPQLQFGTDVTTCPSRFGYQVGTGLLTTSINDAANFWSNCALQVRRCGASASPQGIWTEEVTPTQYISYNGFPNGEIVMSQGFCAPILDAFQNPRNRSLDANTLQTAQDNASDGDIIFSPAPPGGFVTDYQMMGVVSLSRNNISLNFAPGWRTIGRETRLGGTGLGTWFIIGNALTATNAELGGPIGDSDALIKFTDSAIAPGGNGRSGNDLLDGMYLHGNIGVNGGHGVLTAGRKVQGDGMITLINSIIDRNGDCAVDVAAGNFHNWYDGADRNTGGTTGKDQWQNSQSLHAGCLGESMKSRSMDTEIGGTVPISITVSGVTHTAAKTMNIIAQLGIGTQGGQNTADGGGRVIDMPWGGVGNILGNVIEQGPFTDNADTIAYGRELCFPDPAPSRRPTNTLNIENNWIIVDTLANPPPSLGPATILTLGNLFEDCSTPFNPTVTFKNNTIVINNPNSRGVQMASWGSPGNPTLVDGGGNIIYCGTTVYTSPLPSLTAQLPCNGADGSGRVAAGLPPFSDSLASLPGAPPH